jgi:hypothetical protein
VRFSFYFLCIWIIEKFYLKWRIVIWRPFENVTINGEYRISYRDPFTQKYKLKSKGGFKTKPEAKLAAAKAELKIAEGFEQVPESLKTFLEDWLTEYKKGEIRKNTYKLYERNIEKYILPYFKNIRLIDIKPIMPL